MSTEHRDQVSIGHFAQCVDSFRTELTDLEAPHRYYMKDVPPSHITVSFNSLNASLLGEPFWAPVRPSEPF